MARTPIQIRDKLADLVVKNSADKPTRIEVRKFRANILQIDFPAEGERFNVIVRRQEIPVVKPAPPAQGKLLETPESVIGAYGREQK